MQLLRLFMYEQRHRHAPGTLTGDTPVRTVSHHGFDTRLAPVRDPLHAFDLFQRLLAQAFLIHADEPLRGRTEDDRGLVTPAARIAVLHFFNVQQRAAGAQHVDDDVVRFEDVDTVQRRVGARQIRSVRANRVSDFQTVLQADVVVVRTVATGGMHRTGTRFQRHVVAQDRRNVEVQERVFEAHQLQRVAFHGAQHGVVADMRALQHALNQIFRQDNRLTFNLNQRVFELTGQGDRAVGWQGPRGGGPDHQRDRAVYRGDAKFSFHRILIDGLERHVDRWRGFVVIFNFRFCQRRTAVHAPVHRLSAFVQVAVTDDFTQRTDDVGFSFEVHGQVRMRPVAQHAQTDEVSALTVNLRGCVFAALRTELGGGELLTRLAKLLLHFQLDWQTVAVPAWNVRRVISREAFGLHDNVFQNLVNRVTNMNAAIQVIIGPTRQHSRFALGEIAAHREPCFRQIQG